MRDKRPAHIGLSSGCNSNNLEGEVEQVRFPDFERVLATRVLHVAMKRSFPTCDAWSHSRLGISSVVRKVACW